MSILKRLFGRQGKMEEKAGLNEPLSEAKEESSPSSDEVERLIRRLEIEEEGPLVGDEGAKRFAKIVGEYGLEFYWTQPYSAAERLGDIGDKRAVEPLIRALKINDWRVRCNAIGSLVKIGDRRAVTPLIEQLEEDYWPAVTENAAWALGEMGDKRAIEPLARAMQHRLPQVREAASAALNKLRKV